MILAFFFVKKCFPYTDAANDDTSVVLDLCWSLSKNLSSTPACVRNVHHIDHLTDSLVVVDLDILLVV